jgi:glyoxylase-like metal-dependent hydrolase (beta-lactamase superfamily II)
MEAPMRIHHLNCISTCPLGGRLMDGRTRSLVLRGLLTCHCLLIETPSGLVLVDTGFGTRDVADPRSRLSRFFLFLVKPEFREEMTAVRQIERMGFDPRDVRHIVLTHLDFDHAGGLDDFPDAEVHVMADEAEYARRQKTWLDRARFRPQQWSTMPNWRLHRPYWGERWFGFGGVYAPEDMPPDILMIPLPGHTVGHIGIAVRRSSRWLLLAGDAYFYHAEMDVDDPRCTLGLRFYQWMMEKNRAQRLENQERLRELKREHGREVDVLCSHDVVEFERFAGRSARIPAEQLAVVRHR